MNTFFVKIAHDKNLKTIGLLGELLEAKWQGIIISVREIVDEMINRANFWVSADVYQTTLQQANEL